MDGLITSVKIIPASNNDQFNWKYSEVKRHMEVLRSNQSVLPDENNYYIVGLLSITNKSKILLF